MKWKQKSKLERLTVPKGKSSLGNRSLWLKDSCKMCFKRVWKEWEMEQMVRTEMIMETRSFHYHLLVGELSWVPRTLFVVVTNWWSLHPISAVCCFPIDRTWHCRSFAWVQTVFDTRVYAFDKLQLGDQSVVLLWKKKLWKPTLRAVGKSVREWVLIFASG